MKLFVLEYHGSYVGGSVVCAFEDLESLAKISNFVSSDYEVIVDEYECAKYKIHRDLNAETNYDGTLLNDAIDLLKQLIEKHTPKNKFDSYYDDRYSQFTEAYRLKVMKQNLYEQFIKGFNESNMYDEKTIRLDWATRIITEDLKEGLYLVATIDDVSIKTEGIISHTYHSG